MRTRAVIVTRWGGPDVLEVREEELPVPGPGMAQVRVRACGLSFADILIREGTYPGAPVPPFTSGYDFIGYVDHVGEGVEAVKVGDLVAALTVTGAHGEDRVWPARDLVVLPAGLDPVAASCLVLNYMTAYQMLHRTAQVKPGERILIHGATGGVGAALLELGRIAGLQMYGTASGERKNLVAQLGGTPIDYRTEDFVTCIADLTGEGVDVVFDGIGGDVSRRSWRVLRPGGRLVLYGHYSTLVSGRRDMRKVLIYYASALSVLVRGIFPGRQQVLLYRIAKLRQWHPDWFCQDLLALADLLATGAIAPLIAATVPLVEARRAHEMLGRGGMTGTIVLTCNEEAGI
jgi:NADPH:quinone reductase